MIVLSHPTGNSNVRAVANSLLSNGMLSEFHTTIAAYPDNIWGKASQFAVLSSFQRRKFNNDLEPYTKLHPWTEAGRLMFSKIGVKSLIQNEHCLFSIDKVYKSLDVHVARRLRRKSLKEINAVYAYEDGALESFKTAKRNGLLCIYDLPIMYWETARALLTEEAERLPAWSSTLTGLNDSEAKLERKVEELELADVIVAPGSCVLNSLPDWTEEKNKIISPFGSPHIAKTTNFKKPIPGKKLKILFVGSMGQRKGLADLFEAIKILNNSHIELIVLGSLLAPLEFYKKQNENFIYEPGREHKKVLELMRSCDVFCLPSLVEGRALVMQEAMSQGLPLIITSNTGGEDLIIPGKTGYLVPIRSPQVIAEKIQWFWDNKEIIPLMSQHAIEHSQKYTWEKYGNHISKELGAMLKPVTTLAI